ncbi:hypothetical protein [Virgibacillus sediminis]|uniref:hypothetical protein n=1 Tax=Virgibacillus sediminis TaxID=202260 RepID=UPI0036F292A8
MGYRPERSLIGIRHGISLGEKIYRHHAVGIGRSGALSAPGREIARTENISASRGEYRPEQGSIGSTHEKSAVCFTRRGG